MFRPPPEKGPGAGPERQRACAVSSAEAAMADLTARTKTALDESRTIILGAQVLLGFQFQGVFRDAYEELPSSLRHLDAVALILMAATVGILIAPSIYHRIITGGEDTGRMHARICDMTRAALLPFAIGLGIDIYIAFGWIGGIAAGAVIGVGFGALALFWWYGFGLMRRPIRGRKEREMVELERNTKVETPLHAKIEQMLTEARVVLPGAQALFGFQLAVVITAAFEKLPIASKTMHAASLGCVALAIVLLMAPAAYHRIVYAGQDNPEFHRTGSIMLTAATVPLALGIAGDVYVVMTKVFESSSVGAAIAAIVLAGYIGLWHVYPALRRGRE
jgi:hypothetical protein